MRQYIISLKHTCRNSPCFTFWCPNDSGYTSFIEHAGVYEHIIDGYHNNPENCILVSEEFVKENMIKCFYEGIIGHVLLINPEVLSTLNITIKELASSFTKVKQYFIQMKYVKELTF